MFFCYVRSENWSSKQDDLKHFSNPFHKSSCILIVERNDKKMRDHKERRNNSVVKIGVLELNGSVNFS
jgi:hypothetical protein